MDRDEYFGVIAEFKQADDLKRAAEAAIEAGYRDVEAYSPYPIDGLAEKLRFRTWLPLVVLAGGVLGGLGGYALQYWVSVVQWPLNVAGRPPHTWPMFMPITFECTVLGASLACAVGMLLLNGLPRLHHPVFDAQGFERASSHRFFLCIEATDGQFEPARVREFLQRLGPARVSDVPNHVSNSEL